MKFACNIYSWTIEFVGHKYRGTYGYSRFENKKTLTGTPYSCTRISGYTIPCPYDYIYIRSLRQFVLAVQKVSRKIYQKVRSITLELFATSIYAKSNDLIKSNDVSVHHLRGHIQCTLSKRQMAAELQTCSIRIIQKPPKQTPWDTSLLSLSEHLVSRGPHIDVDGSNLFIRGNTLRAEHWSEIHADCNESTRDDNKSFSYVSSGNYGGFSAREHDFSIGKQPREGRTAVTRIR